MIVSSSRPRARINHLTRLFQIGAVVLLTMAGRNAQAQNTISVPFTKGFIGTRASSAGTGNNVLTYQTLGIARTFFIQNSSTNAFEIQGNDVPGTLRIIRTNGTTLDIPASVNWRNSGGSTYLIGILPRPAQPITFAYSGGSIQITDGTVNGGTSVGGYVAAYAGSTLTDGQSTSGNAALSQVVAGLNDYLATVASSRPAGPVTVNAVSTSNTTPTLTGTATLGAGQTLSVVVDGVQYTTSTSPAVTVNAGSWSLTLQSALSVGSYEITATITNTDGFTLSDVTSNELTITAPSTALTLGGSFTAADRVYNGTAVATGNTAGLTLQGVNGGDQVTISSVTLAFASAGIGVGKTVSITAVTLGGTNAASYTVNLTGAPTASAAISAKSLTIGGSFTVLDKVHDGNTAATFNTDALTLVGIVGSESVTIASRQAIFADANVGAGKTVSLTNVTLGGAAAGNYTLSMVGAPTTTASITSPSATVITVSGSFTASDRVYNGTTAATGNTAGLTLQGVNGGDQVTISVVTLTFATSGIGVGKTVSIASVTLGGTHAANYTVSLAGAPTATATISAKTLTIGGSFSANDKPHDGTTGATFNVDALTLVGVVGSEAVTIASKQAVFADANIGTGKTVSLANVTLGGSAAGNYTLSVACAPTATASITANGQATLTLAGSFTANDKVYSATTAATGTPNGLTLVGVNNGDAVSIASVTLAFGTATVGTQKQVTITGVTLTGAQASGYAVSLAGAPTTTAAITPRSITLGGAFASSNKVFDGTAAATIVSQALVAVGVVSGDVVTVTATQAAFNSPTVGQAKPVALTTVSVGGTHAPNYTLSLAGAPTTTANITSAGGVLTITGTLTARDKVYDGTVVASGSVAGLMLQGVTAGDDVSIAAIALAFGSSSAGNNKPVSISSVSLIGAQGSLYSVNLVSAPTGVASITAKPITISGISVPGKVYDGTVAATVQGTPQYVGLAAGETHPVRGVLRAQFDAPHVGFFRTVRLDGAQTPNGNYRLSDIPSLTASIDPRPVTLGGSFQVHDKVFDGTTDARLATSLLTVSGAVNGEQLTLESPIIEFESASIGTNKLVTIRDVRLSGPYAANYVLRTEGAPTSRAAIRAATPSSAPRDVRPEAGDQRLRVTWQLPLTEGCGPVDRWIVQYRAVRETPWRVQQVTTRLPMSVELTSLTNGLPYDVRVAAVNSCGTSDWTDIGTATPVGPARMGGSGGTGSNTSGPNTAGLPYQAPGTSVTRNANGVAETTTTTASDSALTVHGAAFSLGLVAIDAANAPIPIDTPIVLQLEQGGRTEARGAGFLPGSTVALYLYSERVGPVLMGSGTITATGAFLLRSEVPSSVAAGAYTLQVAGVDPEYRVRSVSLGIEVVEQPPELEFTATPEKPDATVGDTTRMVLKISNSGRGPATDVIVPRAFRESGLEFVSATVSAGRYDAATHRWIIDRIDAGQEVRLTLTLRVVAPPTSER